MPEFAGFLGQIIHFAQIFFAATWWFFLFLFSVPFLQNAWLTWRQTQYKLGDKYVLYEMKIPRETLRTPKAMEQLFQSVHNLQNGPSSFGDKYLEGEVGRKFTFEMVSFSGEIHFYVRFYHRYKTLMQAAFFSYYPDVELVEVEDYTKKLPHSYADLDAAGFDMFGSEMGLSKSPIYPIRTYIDFETPDEEAQMDPIAVFIEVLSKIKPGEVVGIQYVLSPIGSKWAKEYKEELDELKQPKAYDVTDKGFPLMSNMTPGEVDAIKAIERKISKPAFKTVIRFIYLSPKNTFYDSFARRGVSATFNQYAANHLNSFNINHAGISPMAAIWFFPFVFSGERNILRKQRVWNMYLKRAFPAGTYLARLLNSHPLNWEFHSTPIILNVEEMATLFHPPTKTVLTAPHIDRVTSRKAGPPAGLPIYGEEKDIERFMGNANKEK